MVFYDGILWWTDSRSLHPTNFMTDCAWIMIMRVRAAQISNVFVTGGRSQFWPNIRSKKQIWLDCDGAVTIRQKIWHIFDRLWLVGHNWWLHLFLKHLKILSVVSIEPNHIIFYLHFLKPSALTKHIEE